jgi:serine-type D-Ala-D-Ala carboxypeptidase/endopeptidase
MGFVIQNFKVTIVVACVFAGFVTSVIGAQASSFVFAGDAEIRKILDERIGVHGNDIGIIVGILEPQGRRIISSGHRSANDARPPDGDTVFEIGSLTKVFTSLLLADMVETGQVALADPVAKYLPADIKVPERNGRSITFVDLATHTSGLPFMPENAAAGAKYAAADLKQYVVSYQLNRDIGAKWEYSNIGYWVMSEALSARGGMDYQNLLRKRVIAPLKLTNTDFVLPPGMKANLALGHDASMQPAPVISTLPIYSVMPAAGGLYSTVNDLLMLLSCAMDYEPSPLAPAVDMTLNTRRATGGGSKQTLGWTVFGEGDDQIIFRDGGTVGYATAMAWDPKNRAGVVVLFNQIGDVADIARHLLRPDFPLTKQMTRKHNEIALDSRLLDSYIGRYEAKGEGIFTIARDGDFLTIESPADWGLPKLRIRPESQMDFFAAELPVRVVFTMDSNSRVTGLLIYPPRGQNAVPANKLPSNIIDAP